MAHIEIINGKETLVASKNIKVCMKLEDPKGTLQAFENTNKKHPTGNESASKK